MGTEKRNRKKENRRQRLDDLAKQQQRKRTRKLATRAAIFIAVVVGVALIISVSGGSDSTSTSDTTVDTAATAPVEGRAITGETPCPAVDGSEARASTFENAPSNCLDASKTYTAVVTTNKGEFSIVLDQTKAPLAANNFITLARYKYFDNTQCHRAILDLSCSVETQLQRAVADLDTHSQMNCHKQANTNLDPLPWRTLAPTPMAANFSSLLAIRELPCRRVTPCSVK